MIRILHSVSNLDRGGIESMLMNYYRNLDREDFQFDFLVHKDNIGYFEKEVRELGGHIYRAPGFSPLEFGKYKAFMNGLLCQDKPEDDRISILHAHNEAMELYPLLAAKEADFPVRIAHAHNTRLPKNAKLPVKRVCKQFIPDVATDFWACGEDAGKYYFHEKWDESGFIMHNAIDLQRFTFDAEARARIRSMYGIGNKFVVGCVGRFMEQKNHERLLEIFSVIHGMYPDSALLLVGDGELRENLIAKIENLGLNGSVFFTGAVKDPAPFYSAMDVHAMPSLFEGLPVSGIEAQVSGLPCIFSSTITGEVCFPGCSCRKSLNASNDEWAKLILSARYSDIQRERLCQTATEIARNYGYDIRREAKIIQQKYVELTLRGK